jgi:hypothetical protein
MLLVLGSPAAATAATLTVCASGCDHTTVQAAVTAADPGDTVSVASGTYAEDVTITKALTIQGPQAGVDARTRSAGAEAIVRSLVVRASDVVVDGLTVSNPTGQSRIESSAAPDILSGVVVRNVIFSGYDQVGVIADRAGDLRIEQSRFEDPTASAEAMQIKSNGVDGGCDGTTVTDNVFDHATTNGSADVNFSCTGSASTDVTVTGNVGGNPDDANGSSLVAFSGVAGGITVRDNTATTAGSQVFFFGSVTGAVEITGNTFTGGQSSAVAIYGGELNGHADVPSTGSFTLTDNDLSGNARALRVSRDGLTAAGSVVARGNDLSGGSATGVENASPGSVDASGNWWGRTGGADGADVVGDVTTAPWCTDAACTTQSNEADLASLAVSSGSLSPAFDRDTTTYAASVSHGVTSISVTAAAAPGASASCPGSTALDVGANTLTCTVTAADGTTTKTYTVTVTRASAPRRDSGPRTTTPPTSPPGTTPPVTAPSNNHAAPVAAPAQPNQSGSIHISPPAAAPAQAEGGSSPPSTVPPKPVEVAWQPGTFGDEPVTVSVAPQPALATTPPPTTPGDGTSPPSTVPPPVDVGGGLTVGAGNTVLDLVATDGDGQPITQLAAPLTITIPVGAGGQVPAYSRDGGRTWVTIPQLASPELPPGQSDGYFVNPDGSIAIITSHLTYFGLLTDGQAPAIGKFGVLLAPDARTLRIVWGAQDNVGVASYVLVGGSPLFRSFPATATEVTVPRVDGNYALAAVDGAGNVARSTRVTVDGTTVVVDATPPTPARLRGRVRGTRLLLDWAPSRDQTRVTYLVFRNGRFLAETTAPSIVLPRQRGWYTVDAVDRAGHRTVSPGLDVFRHRGRWRFVGPRP